MNNNNNKKKTRLTLWSMDMRAFKFDEDGAKELAVESTEVRKMVYTGEKYRLVPVGSRALSEVIKFCKYEAKLKKMAKEEVLIEQEEANKIKSILEDAYYDDDDDDDGEIEEEEDDEEEEDEDDDDEEDYDKEAYEELKALSALYNGIVEVEPAIVNETVQRWIDDDILQLGHGMLLEVITAAHDLVTRSLLDLVCPIMLDMVRHKDLAKVNEIFNMKMDYPDEEIAKIFDENNLMLLPPRRKEQQ